MKFKIDGKDIETDGKKTILEICREIDIHIPTLCFRDDMRSEARCRLCIVDIDDRLVTSCSTYPKEGCEIHTDTDRVKHTRKMNAELLMAEHSRTCSENKDEHDLCKIGHDAGVGDVRFAPTKNHEPDLSESVLRDNNKCINCGNCVRVCGDIMNVHAIDFVNRGADEIVSPYAGKRLHDVACIKCGQCIAACPVGAIFEREHLKEVEEAIADPKKHVVVQTAPSVRVALGEEFDMPLGTVVTGKMVAVLRKLGFDKIFDTDLGADLTIMEEGTELLKRVKKGGPFPMITTCCPGWIKMMEHFHHDLFPHMSSCKSPHEMLGILTKTYYAKKTGIKPKDIVVVSIMPCTAKKFESTREEMKSDVDYVMTTRELAKMIKHHKIDFTSLPDEEFDDPLGASTGAGVIFGATGGVMEAALRTAYEVATGEQLTKIEFEQIRGVEGIKDGSMILNGTEIKFAVASGGHNIKELLKRKDDYHFIEMMACPGGCICGGGQPIHRFGMAEVKQKRMEAIYQADADLPLRKSHENPSVQEIYKEFLEKPGSKKAEKLLHTHYVKRDCF